MIWFVAFFSPVNCRLFIQALEFLYVYRNPRKEDRLAQMNKDHFHFYQYSFFHLKEKYTQYGETTQ